ncbi:MAG TPA: NAD-dependent epimerase/dehydratase family protein [Gemmatimonadaceae bacterium]|nr:NAD-dependent epimerase/dehydratase family protein [Gemmatimonadaceae bacterium]
MARTALVTGGAGFIGSHVADLLTEEGYTVTVLDNLTSGKREQVPRTASFIDADITSPEAAALVRDSSFDVICHLAAQIDVRKSVADPAADSRLNIGGTLNLLEAVRQGSPRTRFIFSSTGGAVYGDLVPMPVEETASKDPQSPYGTAKLSAEYYMGYYSRVHGLDTVALRYANVYGPRQDPHGEAGVVAIFCNRILDGSALAVFGDGRQTRDYVYALDVARANLLACTAELPRMTSLDSRAFNIGTSVETNVLKLAEILKRTGKSDVAMEHLPARAGEQMRSAVQITKARRVLGWEPRVALAQGLANTFEWFATQRSGARS